MTRSVVAASSNVAGEREPGGGGVGLLAGELAPLDAALEPYRPVVACSRPAVSASGAMS